MERPSVRHLEAIVAVADHLSFRKAAEACYVTQPALSAQIQQVEALLGVRLFERDRRRVLPTPAGAELAERARAVLADVDALAEAARAFGEPLAGTLRLGVIPTVAPYALPDAVRSVHAAYPDLRMLLTEDQTARLVARAKEGELDVLLLALEAELEDLEVLPLYRDPFVLTVPLGHPLADREAVGEEDLLDHEVLLLDDGHCLRDQALQICRAARASELDDFRASSLNTLVRMVASGIGVTLLPAMAAAVEIREEDGLVARPFRAPAPGRTIGLAWRRSSPRGSDYALLADVLREHAPPGTLALD